MLGEFHLLFKSESLDYLWLSHVQFNVYKRLRKIKYLKYRRIDFELIEGIQESFIVDKDWGWALTMHCRIDDEFIHCLRKFNNFGPIYDLVFAALQKMWRLNEWNEADLKTMHQQIIDESFISEYEARKALASQDKKLKAQVLCRLYPERTDYFIRTWDRKKGAATEILFWSGFQDISMFLGLFHGWEWRDNEFFLIKGFADDIYFVFNLPEKNVKIEFRALSNTIKECENFLNAFRIGVGKKERLRLLGLPGGN